MPCCVYSRTSQRLTAALSGRDARDIPDKGICTPDCFQFALCFPFYGCILAKLQTTVRSFYDIEGTDVSDWTSGCCCPCVTLVRNENEILHRERQAHRVKDRESSVTEPYCSPPRMVHPLELEKYGSPAPTEHTHTHSHRGEPVARDDEAEPDTRALAAIPEVSRETSAAGLPCRSLSNLCHRGWEPSSADPIVTMDTGLVKSHDLGQDLDVYPISRESRPPHGIEEDVRAPASTPTINHSHELRHDDATAAQVAGPSKGHTIERDRLEPLSRPEGLAKESSKHDIHHDHTAPKARPVTPHDLQEDTAIHSLRRGPALHTLDADEATPRKAGDRRAHGLPNDK
ncbi:hypothetical protein AK830_g5792 [Neonectria ditissima]|uniref:Uncharacterized protein n=1 Tax=Neonectria ditissima TaxID=78410 RepID=A0A0P7BID7_9HYPO|nr:hypothetical protein AK830_g5792 [Neonectria ditissima]